jgi:pimeloyl-ACP methyl ester carboxylesterase
MNAPRAINVCGTTLAVADEGRGSPIVLVHGFPLDHSMWEGQIRALAPRYRVVAPDLRGFGGSRATAGAVAMEQFADDLAAMLDGLDVAEPVVFCGLSMGGYIALEFWRKYASRLRAMILCDTKAAADSAEAAATRCKTADRVESEGPAFMAETMLPRIFGLTTQAAAADCVEATRRVIVGGSRDGIAAASRGMAARRDFSDRLGAIQCPVLVVVGENDILTTPDSMRELARGVAHGQFALIPRAGHMAPLEQPDAVNARIEQFMEQLSNAR